MRQRSGILVVRNRAQQALFELELKGQLSDGHWENSSPSDHWEVWSSAKVEVAPPGGAVGRTFYARRDRYAFASTELLEVVGGRMLAYARVALRFGLEVAAQFEEAEDGLAGLRLFDPASPMREGEQPGTDEYWARTRALAKHLLGAFPIINAIAAGTHPGEPAYTRRDMVRDLKDLGAIVKVRLEPAQAAY